MEARKALKSGGRFLSDLFKGSGSGVGGSSKHHHHGGGGLGSADEDDEEDGHASSTQAQSHAQALERFVTFVHGAMAAAPPANAKPPPSHQPTLSSSSLSMSASINSSAASSDDEAEEEGEAEHEQQSFLLRPTFRSVPVHDLLQHADASLAAVERIAAYVDERWRLEARYVRDRSRLKLQLLQKEMAHADTLDALSEALALFGEVQSMQIGATVEEVDQQVRQPLLQLRDQLKGIVEKGRQKHRAMAKEIDGLEHRLTKSKAGLARLRNRAEELRARIEQYRRLVAARRSDGAGALWGDYPPDTPDPARVSGFAVDEHQQRSPPSAEGQILASLERRLAEVEGEMRASAREIEAQGRLLLDALGRQDRMRARMAQALERSDTLRRSGLQAASTAFVEAEARATQRSLFQLESLMQLAARVDAERDQQAFIARHRDGVGTAPRAPALRVLLDHQEWRGRLQRRHGGEEEEGHWHEVGMGAAPSSPPASFDGMLIPRPLSVRAVECDDDEEEENGEEVASPTTKGSPPSRDVDSPTSSPDRTGVHGGRKERREEVVVPSFDEKEDGAVVASFVQQLFAADRATEEASGAAAAPSPEAAAATDKKGRLELREGYFDWDRFPTSTESPSSTAAAAVGGFSFHSTATERARFFDRVLATEDGRGRAAFLAELNLQRSKKTNIGAGFEELAQLLWTFLLHAQRHRDVHGAKLGMMLASTFYRLRPGLPGTAAAPADKETKREFLSRRLQDHPLWRDAAFWTRALQEQVREQLEEMGELLPFGAKAWHDAGHEARAEVVARIHNTCFSNAAALAHSMLEVGAPIEDARTFAVRVSEQYGLPEEAEHMLLQHLARREQRHSHHHRPSKHEQRQPQPQPQQQPTMLPGQEGGHVTESSIG